MINGRLIFPTGNSILQVAQALEGPAPFSSPRCQMVSCWAGAQAPSPLCPGADLFLVALPTLIAVCVPVVLTSVCWEQGRAEMGSSLYIQCPFVGERLVYDEPVIECVQL